MLSLFLKSNLVFCFFYLSISIGWAAKQSPELITGVIETDKIQSLIDGTSSSMGLVTSVSWSPDGKRVVTGSTDDSVRIWDVESGEELRKLEGHFDWVASVSWSPDGKRVVTGSGDRTVRIWDVRSGKELYGLEGHTDWVSSVSWSPDGKRVVTASGDLTVRIWDVESGEELKKLEGHTDWVGSVSWSPDGKRIVTGSGDRTVRIWDVESGEELKKLDGHSDSVREVSWSPDGKRIVTGSNDKSARTWDVKSGEELKKLKGHSDSVRSVSWSPDGKRVVAGLGDRTVRIWDVEGGKELRILEGHNGTVSSVSWSLDGKRLATGSEDHSVRIWDVESGEELKKLEGHSDSVLSVVWGPEGKRLATSSGDRSVRIWDVESGEELKLLEGSRVPISSVAWSPDGKQVVTGSYTNFATIWDIESGIELKQLDGHSGAVTSASWSPDGKRVVTGSYDEHIRIWDVESGEELKKMEGYNKGLLYSVSWSPDGKRLASGSDDKSVRIWDVESGEELKKLEGHSGAVNSVAWSPDGKRVVTGSGDRTVRIWDVRSGKELYGLEGHTDWVSSVSWSPDGKRVVTASGDLTVRIWDVESGEELKKLEGHTDWVGSVSWSPDGKRIVTGSGDRTVRIWDVESGEELKKLDGHSDSVREVSWSPDGKRIVTGSNDKSARTWDVKSGEELKKLKGHSDSVRSVSWSPDGKRVVAGLGDRTVRIWDVEGGKELRILEGHNGTVSSVSWSLDGKRLATGSEDHSVRIWDVESGEELKKLEGHSDSVLSVVWGPEGKRLATSSGDRSVRIWDVESGEELKLLEGSRVPISSVAWSPDGKQVVTGSYTNFATIWDIESGIELKQLDGHSGAVTSASWSPDGKRVVTGSYDEHIRIWDVESGEELKKMEGYNKGLLYSVSWSPDGKRLASGSDDKSVRIWDVESGEELKKLEGHSGAVNSVAWSPDGKRLASGSDDGSVRFWDREGGNWQWRKTFVSGQRGLWASIARDGQFSRRDDGSFMRFYNKDTGQLKPWLPAETDYPALPEIAVEAENISLKLGQLTPLKINLKNTGKGILYWPYLTIEGDSSEAWRLNFKQPDMPLVLEEGQSISLDAAISWYSDNHTPTAKTADIRLLLHHAHDKGKPLAQKISVNMVTPQLTVNDVSWLRDGSASTLAVKLTNSGKQNLSASRFMLSVEGQEKPLPITEQSIDAEQVSTLTFALPEQYEPDNNTRVNLAVSGLAYPRFSWKFDRLFVSIPAPAWWLYLALFILLLFILFSIYYLRLYRNPLVVRLSEQPDELFSLMPSQLFEAEKLLRKTQRWSGLLKTLRLDDKRVEQLKSFTELSPADRCDQLVKQLTLEIKNTGPADKGFCTVQLEQDFPLNMMSLLLYTPEKTLSDTQVYNFLKQQKGIRGLVIVCLHADEQIQTALNGQANDRSSMLVAPSPAQITQLLLSSEPLLKLAKLISLQVNLTQISPYQTGGGVNRSSSFFGREAILSHVLNRDLANYLLVGGRQLGKSSLLKAIQRSFIQQHDIDCQYFALSGGSIVPHLAHSLNLAPNSDLDAVVKKLMDSDKPHFFLVDEADEFISVDREAGYVLLKQLRSLSESGKAFFMLAGFWELYRHAALDYQSPLKNFGETLTIASLEKDACYDLATKPMALMDISWADDGGLQRLIQATGQRANLVSIACNEIIKGLDQTQRVLEMSHVEQALDSEAIRTSLEGWKQLVSDPAEQRCLRLIVYSTVADDNFTLSEVSQKLEKHGAAQPIERLEKMLDLLTLAYVLGRGKERYSYRVPLFKEMILSQEPDVLLKQALIVNE